MDDPNDPSLWLTLSIFKSLEASSLFGLGFMLALLACSALMSGAEVAFFSLSPQDKDKAEESESKSGKELVALMKKPKSLLATILIGNNLVNVAIIILSSLIMEQLFDLEGRELVAFFIQVVAVTLLILIAGEIVPKIYASKNALFIASFMALPISWLYRVFKPLVRFLVESTKALDRRAIENDRSAQISVDELSHALDLTSDNETKEDEKRILKGIVKFGSTDVSQVMTPRIDVICVDKAASFEELLATINEHGFSRLPVIEGSFDTVVGVIYIKDILPFLEKPADFKWQRLVREPFFITENKKLDDLLREFQEKKIHMAIVVDEYGGSSGVISLEDVIEEIVGEISDEFDEEETFYHKIDNRNYVFEGKTQLMDVYKVLEMEGTEFEAKKGDSDTLAGVVLELAGKIPQKNEKIRFGKHLFTIEAADRRRIKKIKVSLNEYSD